MTKTVNPKIAEFLKKHNLMESCHTVIQARTMASYIWRGGSGTAETVERVIKVKANLKYWVGERVVYDPPYTHPAIGSVGTVTGLSYKNLRELEDEYYNLKAAKLLAANFANKLAPFRVMVKWDKVEDKPKPASRVLVTQITREST